MTVQELIDKLQEIPDKDTQIIIDADCLLMEIQEVQKGYLSNIGDYYSIYAP